MQNPYFFEFLHIKLVNVIVFLTRSSNANRVYYYRLVLLY